MEKLNIRSVMQSSELTLEFHGFLVTPLPSCYLNRNPERKKEKRDRRDRSIRSVYI